MPSLDVDVFGAALAEWWSGLQPAWRTAALEDGQLRDPSQFSQVLPDGGESWKTLKKGGTSGLYTVVLCIAWWFKSLAVDAIVPPLLRSLTLDVTFVLDTIIASLPESTCASTALTEKRCVSPPLISLARKLMSGIAPALVVPVRARRRFPVATHAL